MLSIAAALMVSWVHWGSIPQLNITLWLGFMCLIQVARLALAYRKPASETCSHSFTRCRNARIWVNALNGAAWGAIWFALDSGQMDFLFMFKFGAIAGSTGIAVNSLGVVFPVYFAFLATQIGGTIGYFLINTPFLLPAQRISFITGAAVYALVLAMIARNTSILTKKAFEQGFEREQALAEAKESHQREQTLRENLQTRSRQVEEANQKLNEANERLNLLARQDVLTGIFNRRHLLEELERNVLALQRYDTAYSLILFDIDHFKQINDTYGHQTGDLVLKAVTEQIATGLREIDAFGRWGGEEFLCILPNTSYEEALSCAERLCRQLAQSRLLESIPELAVTASFGVVTGSPLDDMDAIMSRADMALYQAKATGRNRVVGSNDDTLPAQQQS